MTTNPEALAAQLQSAVQTYPQMSEDEPGGYCTAEDQLMDAAAAELRRLAALEADNAKLRTVMVAAAEEISEHWEAHCDAEGYGPANLMRRLEDGIPSEYGYTAGAFAKLLAERDALLAAKPRRITQATVQRKLEQGLHSQGWMVVGLGGSWAGLLKPLMQYLNPKDHL